MCDFLFPTEERAQLKNTHIHTLQTEVANEKRGRQQHTKTRKRQNWKWEEDGEEKKTKRKIGNSNIILGCSLQPNSIPHTRTLIREIRAKKTQTQHTQRHTHIYPAKKNDAFTMMRKDGAHNKSSITKSVLVKSKHSKGSDDKKNRHMIEFFAMKIG